ncbi:unnamed protein product [Clonostachys solani]|uniref:Uncharacterized protein n=1 Tax=Clonostachys solani TaxID=160281 RepID=A0A9N9Z1H0_9HYPO|nr:unnamed protein product [Clonostachys solani]
MVIQAQSARTSNSAHNEAILAAPFNIRLLGDPTVVLTIDEQLLSALPACYMNQSDDLDVPELSDAYIWRILDVDRLDQLARWLWMAGRPRPPLPLHIQVSANPEILLTERIQKHLVWNHRGIFIKPMPRLLLEPHFWDRHLSCLKDCLCSDDGTEQCDRRKAYRSARGFLFSYAALVRFEGDFLIAKDKNLLPSEVTWGAWREFVRQTLASESIYEEISPRFVFGELDTRILTRMLNAWSSWSGQIRYERYGFRYGSFFRDSFSVLATITVFIAIVLTAMQVGLATTLLSDNATFQSVSYGFTVFSLVAPLTVAAVVFYLYSMMLFFTWAGRYRYKSIRLRAIHKTLEKS